MLLREDFCHLLALLSPPSTHPVPFGAHHLFPSFEPRKVDQPNRLKFSEGSHRLNSAPRRMCPLRSLCAPGYFCGACGGNSARTQLHPHQLRNCPRYCTLPEGHPVQAQQHKPRTFRQRRHHLAVLQHKSKVGHPKQAHQPTQTPCQNRQSDAPFH